MNSMGGGTGYSGLAGPNGQVGNKVPKGYKYGQISQYTPQQQQLFGQQFAQTAPDSFTSRLANGDQSAFDEYERPALRQFNELQGGISSRFSGGGGGQGSLGARRSSGFQNTMNQASSNFAQELASKRLGLRNDAIKSLMSMSSELLGQRPYETYLEKKEQKPSGWGGVIGGSLGAAGGFLAGGPAGALTGANLGYNMGSGF